MSHLYIFEYKYVKAFILEILIFIEFTILYSILIVFIYFTKLLFNYRILTHPFTI